MLLKYCAKLDEAIPIKHGLISCLLERSLAIDLALKAHRAVLARATLSLRFRRVLRIGVSFLLFTTLALLFLIRSLTWLLVGYLIEANLHILLLFWAEEEVEADGNQAQQDCQFEVCLPVLERGLCESLDPVYVRLPHFQVAHGSGSEAAALGIIAAPVVVAPLEVALLLLLLLAARVLLRPDLPGCLQPDQAARKESCAQRDCYVLMRHAH